MGYEDLRTLFADSSPEEKLAILRVEILRNLSSIEGYAFILGQIKPTDIPQLPDGYLDWCKTIIENAREIDDLLSASGGMDNREIRNQKRHERDLKFGASMWTQHQKILPELQDFKDCTEAILQTLDRLGNPLPKAIQENLRQHWSDVIFRTPTRLAHFIPASSPRPAYALHLSEMIDKRNHYFEDYDVRANSLEKACLALYAWIVEEISWAEFTQEYKDEH